MADPRMTVTCLDNRRPHPISEPHGPWWLIIRLPLTRRRHLYLGAATGRRWKPRVEPWCVALPWACVAVPRVGFQRPSVSLQKWCAHINVEYPS